MRLLTPILACVIAFLAWREKASSQTLPTVVKNSCVNCHAGADDDNLAEPVVKLKNDIHAQRGFSCANCHGGDGRPTMERAKDPRKGFVGAQPRSKSPDFAASVTAMPRR